MRNLHHFSYIALGIVIFLLSNVKGQRCPLYWTMWGNSCYRLRYVHRMNWNDAKDHCRSQGGDLVKLETAAEYNWLTNLINYTNIHSHPGDQWWIGISDNNPQSAWRWADNSAVTSSMLHWARGNPSNVNNDEHCVNIVSGKMDDKPCWQTKNYVCERDRSTPLTCDADRGWQTFSPYCYKVQTNRASWNTARNTCRQQGGDLVTIYNATDEKSVYDFAKNTRVPMWIGLHSFVDGHNNFNWQWSDNTNVNQNQMFWQRGSAPSLPANQKNNSCVYMSPGAPNPNAWQTSPCNARNGFVCLRPEGVCASGWIASLRNCYQFNIQIKSTWFGAKNICERQGGKMLEIYSHSDQMFVDSYLDELRAAGIDSFWIGATDKNTSNYVWSQGARISFMNWAQAHPNNTANRQDCVFIPTAHTQGKWTPTPSCLLQKAFVCMIPMGKPVHAVTTPRTTYTCDPGWILHGSSCYKFMDQRRNWFGAQRACQGLQAHLAKIPSDDVQSFLYNHVKNQHGVLYWIGLNDQKQEHHFVWSSDLSPVRYTKWNPGQPSNSATGENCVEINRGPGWNDVSCSNGNKFICEKQPRNMNLTPAPTTAMPFSSRCGINWVDDPNTVFCYQFQDKQLTWVDARTVCRSQGAELASIETREEQFYLAAHISSMGSIAVWIGANDLTREGGWQWSDGRPFAFFNWRAGEPNNYRNGEDCGAMLTQTSSWNDVNCNNRNGFICKKLGAQTTTIATTSVTTPAGKTFGCPPYWSYHSGRCFRLIDNPTTWARAKTLCNQMNGAQLATIRDRSEQNFVRQFITKPHSTYWIGLNDMLTENSFVWADGSAVTFTFWAPNEPNNYRNLDEDCVNMRADYNGAWNDNKCDSPSTGYICERNAGIVSATLPPRLVGCDQGAMGYGPSCYRFISWTTKNFDDANNFCNHTFNGTLATVKNRFVQAFLQTFIEYKGDFFWVGLTDRGTPGQFSWVDGERVQFTFWQSTHTGNEQNTCVSMTTNFPVGLWETKDCSQRHHFICESPRTSGFTTTTSTTTHQPINCPAGWRGSSTNSNSPCYKRFTNSLSWMAARQYCLSLGGDLPSIHDDSTNSLVASVGYPSFAFWIGLNDRDTEAGYVWSDGSGTDFTSWDTNEPNNYNDNEDCVQMVSSSHKWNDNNCYSPGNFVCAINRGVVPITTVTPPTAVTDSAVCGTDASWQYYNGSCYLVDTGNYDWYSANGFCRTKGSFLTSIHSVDENNFILSLMTANGQDSFWIGYNKLGQRGYKWTDGSANDFDYWNANEPNDAFGAERCTDMSRHGEWNDQNCNMIRGSVCKKTPGYTPPRYTRPPVMNSGCTNGFSPIFHSNKCYKVDGIDTPLNWSAARDACVSYGRGHDLAAIAIHSYQMYLNTLLKGLSSQTVWIGLNDLRASRKFVWEDNNPFFFTNWAPNEPNGAGRELCGEMYTRGQNLGQWNDRDCSVALPYVCEGYKAQHYPAPNLQGNCNSNYMAYGQSCYRFYSTAKTWDDAKAQCIRDNANLVVVNDNYEDSFVQALVGDHHNFWIGLTDKPPLANGQYQWVLPWLVSFTNWGPNEPLREDGEGCVAVTGGTWNDTNCGLSLPFVCEINSVKPPPTTPAPPGHCADSSQILFGDYCFYFEVSNLKSWPEARYDCQHRGMELASVHNSNENSFVFSKFTSLKPAPRTPQTNIWIGMTKGLFDGYGWTDQTAVNYFYWNTNEPSDPINSTIEECIEILRDAQGKWNDVSCTARRAYACKTNAILPTTLPTPTTTTPTSKPTTTPSQGGGVTSTSSPVGPNPNSAAPLTQAPVMTPDTGSVDLFTGNPYVLANRKSPTNSNGKSLSGGALAGIIIATLLVLALFSVGAVFLRRRFAASSPGNEDLAFDNALYSSSNQSVNLDPSRKQGSYGNGLGASAHGHEEDA